MTDFNFISGCLSDGQRDLMCSNSSMDELQLAALLGKTLLEKNSDLELKLRRLQEFAEETLAINQSLKRQLSEYKDSLLFSNKTCEQLETKLEDLEGVNSRLLKQADTQRALIEQKTQAMLTLEDDLVESKLAQEKLQEKLKQLGSDNTNSVDDVDYNNIVKYDKRERSGSCCASSESVNSPTETDKIINDLTVRVQKLTFQKEKAENHVTKILAENECLDKQLEKAEAEIDILTKKLCVYEDNVERQLQSSTPPTPKLYPHASTPTGVTHPPLTDEHSPHTQETEESPGGISLFSELDSQFSSLQMNYEHLVESCTCSASIRYKTTSSEVKGHEGPLSESRRNLERPFKELFDEMYATLKQSAQVADRLIERKAIAREE